MTQGRNLRLDCLLLLGIVIPTVLEFSSFLTPGSFGSEFTQFYLFAHDRSFGQVIQGYLKFHGHWYRPAQFTLPYWIGQHLISWHNPHGWRAYELLTVPMMCGLIYWFVPILPPGHRIAAFTVELDWEGDADQGGGGALCRSGGGDCGAYADGCGACLISGIHPETYRINSTVEAAACSVRAHAGQAAGTSAGLCGRSKRPADRACLEQGGAGRPEESNLFEERLADGCRRGFKSIQSTGDIVDFH